jgi:hypothetical protein
VKAESFSPLEREALGLWRAQQPTAGFADRVVADALQIPASAPVKGGRGMAAAAVMALVLGGLWSLRSMVGQHGPPGPGPRYQRSDESGAFIAAPDGGPRPEVNGDGLDVQSS